MEKKSSTIERVLIAISLVWGFYNISRPILQKSNFDYFSISDWFSFVLYIVLFVAIVFFMVKCGTWAYERNEASSLMVKRFLAILGGLILVAFVIIWDDVVVPYFAQNIAT